MKLIDKDAVLAEIEKRIEYNTLSYQKDKRPQFAKLGKIMEDEAILSVINTLEVKEVDLETEIEEQCNKVHQLAVGKELRSICKHFFELGLNASNPLTWEDMKLIWDIANEIISEPEENFYKEVLKRFKAQKGE